ncbi:hypothetical protein [Hamadaea tsunoensis]|uniref:hypothetical protein n=1 Tax=Hamadaea tsunoensis TaxID=53368 RepID=UPI000482C8A3|nr:hypothetical protein [Hamadaea tsunoensis]
MAGLAATLHCPQPTADALADALAPRGADVARQRVGAVTLVVRAALPMIHEVDGVRAVVDGFAELGALLSAYREKGLPGLLGGAEPYAVIVHDGRGLLLACNGDGPSLYFARTARGTMVASEPEALLMAGVPADPDPAVVAAFIATGECDETDATFFAAIRRVRPGQVIRLGGGEIEEMQARPPARRPVSARVALRRSVPGRAGVRAASDPDAADLVDAVLGLADLPVYADPVPVGLDLDTFLADVGEPMPSLDDYRLWMVARGCAGEIDALIDGAPPAAHLARLADRIGSRYGVELRFPRILAPDEPWPGSGTRTRPVVDVLRRNATEAAATLLHDQPAGHATPAIAELAAFHAGREGLADVLYRRLVLGRWLRRYAAAPVPPPVPVARVEIDGTDWRRVPLRTDVLRPGDPLAEKLAWYVAEAVASPVAWYVLVAAKAVAVAQGGVRGVWEIRPRALARLSARLRAAEGGIGRDAWAEQALIDHGGAVRTLAVALCERLGLHGPALRLTTPAMRAVRPPRREATAPADVSVVTGPRRGDEAAAELFATLAKVLTGDQFARLAGCAVVGADGEGVRLVGFAGPGDPAAAVALAKGNPFGQDDRRTPVVLGLAEPARTAAIRPRAGGRKRTARAGRR